MRHKIPRHIYRHFLRNTSSSVASNSGSNIGRVRARYSERNIPSRESRTTSDYLPIRWELSFPRSVEIPGDRIRLRELCTKSSEKSKNASDEKKTRTSEGGEELFVST